MRCACVAQTAHGRSACSPTPAATMETSSQHKGGPEPHVVLFFAFFSLTLLGSMVQKGKFSAGMPILVSVLNSVLLPGAKAEAGGVRGVGVWQGRSVVSQGNHQA